MQSLPRRYLFKPVDDWDEEANIRHTLMVKVPHPLHQLRRRRHCAPGGQTFSIPSSANTVRQGGSRPTFQSEAYLPLSVKMCRQRVTSVSAPLGQFSTRSRSSGEFMPIPRICRNAVQILYYPHLALFFNERSASDTNRRQNPATVCGVVKHLR